MVRCHRRRPSPDREENGTGRRRSPPSRRPGTRAARHPAQRPRRDLDGLVAGCAGVLFMSLARHCLLLPKSLADEASATADMPVPQSQVTVASPKPAPCQCRLRMRVASRAAPRGFRGPPRRASDPRYPSTRPGAVPGASAARRRRACRASIATAGSCRFRLRHDGLDSRRRSASTNTDVPEPNDDLSRTAGPHPDLRGRTDGEPFLLYSRHGDGRATKPSHPGRGHRRGLIGREGRVCTCARVGRNGPRAPCRTAPCLNRVGGVDDGLSLNGDASNADRVLGRHRSRDCDTLTIGDTSIESRAPAARTSDATRAQWS